MLESISFMALALALGFRHSYDSDHMLTAAIVTIILFIFKESFLSNVLPHFEKIAAIMLMVLGILSLKDFLSLHSHAHRHGNIVHSHPHIHLKRHHDKHSHRHMFGVGVVHGLASNNELLMLFTASLAVTSLAGLIAAIGLFSFGVALGMLLFAFVFSYPLIKLHSEKIYKLVSLGTGSIGVIYGTLMLFALA